MPQVIEAIETTALAVIETMSGAELFTPGTIDPILDRIKAEVRAVKTDISTDAGRKAIASLAFKVAKSKTFLDGVRKSLVEGEKKRLKAIDAEGSRIWDELEALQKEVRQPLTDWENAEKDRIRAHEAELVIISTMGGHCYPATTAQIQMSIDAVKVYQTRDWEEFSKRAGEAINSTLHSLYSHQAESQRRTDELAELARLRAEQAAREQREREEAIVKAARDKAEAEARKREMVAAQMAERERQRIEDEKFEAEAKAKQAEAARLVAIANAVAAEKEAEARAERDRLAADAEREAAIARAAEYAKQVEADVEAAMALAAAHTKAAVEAERQRVDVAKRKEAEEAEARARNRAHRAAINREIVQALRVADGVDEAIAKSIVQLIALGSVPHVKVSY